MEPYGIRVVTSPFAEGKVFLINEAELFKTIEPPVVSHQSYSTSWNSFKYEMAAGMMLAPTEVERDPMLWSRPRTLRALWRQMRAIFGYEFRKASGRLRRYPKNRYAVITGLTA